MKVEDEVWTERHRPDTLDEVIGHEDAIEKLQDWVDDDSVPNVLLHGPAGTGKTTATVAFAKDKYGDDWKGNLIEMNASDDRGIDIVRDRIKGVAREAPVGDHAYKIIFLDEADNLTKDAQSALRRTMEQFSDRTRFFLSCNYPNKLIDPIQSRCTALPFHRLEDQQIDQLITNILEKEEVEYEKEAVESIIAYVEGDARRAVHTLQNSVEDGELTVDIVDFVSNAVGQENLEEMISMAISGDVDGAQDMNVTQIQPDVTDHSRLASEIMRVLQGNSELPDNVRWYTMSRLGEAEWRVMQGANPHVQWNAFLAELPIHRHMSLPNYEE